MTSKDLLEQDYIKICPDCGDLASKDSDICENCNHDLSQEPLYDTNDFSEIMRMVRNYKNPGLYLTKEERQELDIQQSIKVKKANDKISCPKCGCTQLSANKKGFSYWTGAIGSQKVYITCLRCGHRWKAGDRR